MKSSSPDRSRALRTLAPLAAMFLLTGSIGMSCEGNQPDDPDRPDGSTRPDSSAMGLWTPNTTHDTCSKSFHDTYFVVGPDGKKYPGWHPPTAVDPANGRDCTFGHEHGRDPRGSALWEFVREQFAFDANRNGVIDPSERDASGLPFGYIAEQLIAYNAANGIANADRLEDHTGYKIAWENSVRRDRLLNGQVQSLDLFCDVLTVLHQESYSAESFASNLHQLTFAIDCSRGADAARYPVRLLASLMATFGNPGSFIESVPGTGDATVTTGIPQPTTSPAGGTERGRVIPTAANVRNDIYVPVGQTSNFSTGLFEVWSAAAALVRNDGTQLATFNPAFSVYSPSRYFDPGLLLTTIGRSIDVCYSGLNAAGVLIDDPLRAGEIVRQARGPDCATVAPNGPATPRIQRVAFDDPRSPFNACRREVSIGSTPLANAGGRTAWFTDPYGRAGQTASFAGSVRQFIAASDNTGSGIVLAENSFGGDISYCPPGAGLHAPN
jgi:hypothetical protein